MVNTILIYTVTLQIVKSSYMFQNLASSRYKLHSPAPLACYVLTVLSEIVKLH